MTAVLALEGLISLASPSFSDLVFVVFFPYGVEKWSSVWNLHPHQSAFDELETQDGLSLPVQTHRWLVWLFAEWFQTRGYAKTKGDFS